MSRDDDEYKPCFIATASFGSAQAPQVQRLRFIRDYSLAKSLFGRTLVEKFENVYYVFSPAIARAMNRSERLTKLIRTVTMVPIVTGLKLIFDR